MEYDSRTTLLVVDVQNDFADPRGNLFVRGGDEILPLVNAEIEKAVSAMAHVIYTQDWHPASTPHFRKDGGTWPVHCVKESWGAAFDEGLAVEGPIVRKGADGGDGYSGFSVRDPLSGDVQATQLDSLLKASAIERLVVVGLATDYCVAETALDARRLGYPVAVLVDATRPVELEPGDGERAIERMRDAGVVLA